MRNLLYILLLLSLNLLAFSQDTLRNAQQELQMYLEDASSNGVNDLDWNVVLERLRYYKKHPLDINKASEEELAEIPFINSYLIKQLKLYIKRNGPLISIYELQAVPGFNKQIFDKIKPYVTVASRTKYDLYEGKKWLAPPKLNDVFSDGHITFYQRFARILEEQEGYLRQKLPDSVKQTKSYYLGNPWRYYTRLQFTYKNRISVGFIGEKDPGELNIYDFTSAHIFLKDFGRFRAIAIGDFMAQFGQGLVLSRGLGFGKTAMTVTGVKASNIRLRQYTSVNEFSYLRGGAISYDLTKKINLTAIYSNKNIDANIQADTLEDQQVFYSLLNSGFHRTQTELDKKGKLNEQLYAFRTEYNSEQLTIGSIFLLQNFSFPMQAGTKPYQVYNFSGKQNYITSLDYDFTLKNFNFFGEIARSKSGGIGALSGVLFSASPKMDISMVYRNFAKNYHSFYGFAFSERPYALNNERGLYIGFEIRPDYNWTFNAFFDKYEFPWATYQRSAPTDGYEVLMQLQRNKSRKVRWYVRFRTETKAKDLSSTKIKNPDYQTRTYARFHIKTRPDGKTYIQNRIEFSFYQKQQGVLIYSEIFKQLNRKLKIGGRVALFDIPSYDARIYAYETNMPTTYSIPAFFGRGTRFYLLLRIKPVRNVDLWVRYARSYYIDREEISSGLEKIYGNTKSDIKLQLRFRF